MAGQLTLILKFWRRLPLSPVLSLFFDDDVRLFWDNSFLPRMTCHLEGLSPHCCYKRQPRHCFCVCTYFFDATTWIIINFYCVVCAEQSKTEARSARAARSTTAGLRAWTIVFAQDMRGERRHWLCFSPDQFHTAHRHRRWL